MAPALRYVPMRFPKLQTHIAFFMLQGEAIKWTPSSDGTYDPDTVPRETKFSEPHKCISHYYRNQLRRGHDTRGAI